MKRLISQCRSAIPGRFWNYLLLHAPALTRNHIGDDVERSDVSKRHETFERLSDRELEFYVAMMTASHV
jgi:hypothetical protein